MCREKTDSLVAVRSNRTFMELKYSKAIQERRKGNSSNRTFMELKLRLACRSLYPAWVLIVPLWN